MYWHWINRNYKYTNDKREYTGSILRHGEVHWRYDASDAGYARNSHTGSVSWHWRQSRCGIQCELGGGDGNNEIELFLGLPWILALWIHHTLPPWIVKRLPQHHYRLPVYGPPPAHDASPMVSQREILGYHEGSYTVKRSIDFRIHSWALWWTIWHDDDCWDAKDPWYRRGSLHLDDAILGHREYVCEQLGPPIRTHVQMLEGAYPVTVQQQRQRWWRRRWPWWPCRFQRTSFDVRCDVGIPFPGKGENSWDCGEDGLFGTAFDVSTVAEACAQYREVVLDYRRRYGGERCANEPWPQAPQERIREYETRQTVQAAQRTKRKEAL